MNKFPVSKEAFKAITADFNHAVQFLSLLEAARDDPYSATATREALTLAAVAAYCRPFTKSRRRDGKKRAWIPKGLVNDLSPDFQKFQKRIRIDRNQMWAPTDEGAFDTRNPIKVFSKTLIPKFKDLIREVTLRLET